MHVDLNQQDIGQLWDEVSGLLQAATTWMVPFLNLFGVKECNMIYPFAVNIETPGDLIQIVEQLLCPKSRDPRDTNNRAITVNLGDNEVDDV